MHYVEYLIYKVKYVNFYWNSIASSFNTQNFTFILTLKCAQLYCYWYLIQLIYVSEYKCFTKVITWLTDCHSSASSFFTSFVILTSSVFWSCCSAVLYSLTGLTATNCIGLYAGGGGAALVTLAFWTYSVGSYDIFGIENKDVEIKMIELNDKSKIKLLLLLN